MINFTITDPIYALTVNMASLLEVTDSESCSIRCWECKELVVFADPSREQSISRIDVGKFTCPYCKQIITMQDCKLLEQANKTKGISND